MISPSGAIPSCFPIHQEWDRRGRCLETRCVLPKGADHAAIAIGPAEHIRHLARAGWRILVVAEEVGAITANVPGVHVWPIPKGETALSREFVASGMALTMQHVREASALAIMGRHGRSRAPAVIAAIFQALGLTKDYDEACWRISGLQPTTRMEAEPRRSIGEWFDREISCRSEVNP